jgi:carboxyl-terminal processing protease
VLPGPYSTDEIGEKSLDYSLPPKQIKSFLSPEAYVTSGIGAWKKVEGALVAQLKTRSQARVAKNAEFQKIVTELKKAKEKSKLVKLSEAQKDTKEKKDEADQKKSLSKDEKAAEYLKRADIQEAVNVAVDLMALQRGITLTEVDAKPGDQDAGTKKR